MYCFLARVIVCVFLDTSCSSACLRCGLIHLWVCARTCIGMRVYNVHWLKRTGPHRHLCVVIQKNVCHKISNWTFFRFFSQIRNIFFPSIFSFLRHYRIWLSPMHKIKIQKPNVFIQCACVLVRPLTVCVYLYRSPWFCFILFSFHSAVVGTFAHNLRYSVRLVYTTALNVGRLYRTPFKHMPLWFVRLTYFLLLLVLFVYTLISSTFGLAPKLYTDMRHVLPIVRSNMSVLHAPIERKWHVCENI